MLNNLNNLFSFSFPNPIRFLKSKNFTDDGIKLILDVTNIAVSLTIFLIVVLYLDAWQETSTPILLSFAFVSICYLSVIFIENFAPIIFIIGGILHLSCISWFWGSQSMACTFILGATLSGLTYYYHNRKMVGFIILFSTLFLFIDLFLLDSVELSFLTRQPLSPQYVPIISPWVLFFACTFCFLHGIRFVHQMQASKQALQNMVTELQERNIHLNQLNEELDKFVYSAAHDLRAPLTSVLGLVNLMEMQTQDATLLQYLDLQRKSVNKLDTFIKDIVDYSRNSRMELEINPIEIETVVKNIYEHFRFMDNADKIAGIVKVVGNPVFYNDKKRVEVVLNNLVSNAVKYADLSKPNPKIEIIATIDTKIAKIEVKDNGQGIEKQHLDKIFNIFYRANKFAVGSGIGLYITKEAMKKMNAEIRVESVFREGTTITLLIPNQEVVAKEILENTKAEPVAVQA